MAPQQEDGIPETRAPHSTITSGPAQHSTRPHPYVAAHDALYSYFGGQWPPRSKFDGWPACFEIYKKAALEMPQKLLEFQSPSKFREWLIDQLKEVDIAELKREIQSRLSSFDPVLAGYLAGLAHLVQMYRWGIIPPTQEEKDRKYMTFPDKLWVPYKMINESIGLLPRGSTFHYSCVNAMYDPQTGEASDKFFFFNGEENVIPQERHFFLSFIRMENIFAPMMKTIRDYLQATEEARNSQQKAKELLNKRVDLLEETRRILIAMFKLFYGYFKEISVSCKVFPGHLQAISAWKINGEEFGASGGEALCMNVVDQFLGLKGESVVYKGALDSWKGMPSCYRDLLETLAVDVDDRFNSFLDHGAENDPLMVMKDQLIKPIVNWRLGHAKLVPPYMKHSKGTAAGHVDHVAEKEKDLATQIESALVDRARETASHRPLLKKHTPCEKKASDASERNKEPVKQAKSKRPQLQRMTSKVEYQAVSWMPTMHLQSSWTISPDKIVLTAAALGIAAVAVSRGLNAMS